MISLPKDRLAGFLIAIGLHATVLCYGGLGLIEKAEFGMGSSDGGFEVDLVAALPGKPSHRQASFSQTANSSFAIREGQELISPNAEKVPKHPQSALQDQTPESLDRTVSNGLAGDGSSPVPGNDLTTQSFGTSGAVKLRPGYYRNPAPAYPEEAKQQGQEGLVVLRVVVNGRGRAQLVTLKNSCGFSMLDESAISAVKNWKFKPARLNGIPIDSEVEVPIRFKLEKS